MNFYNEIDNFAADWLENLIEAGLIPNGKVERRSITELKSEDLAGYKQRHFFAGIAGWNLALQYAGIPPDWPVWTGSCPCPAFSVARRKKACPECKSKNLIPHPLRTGFFVCCKCGNEWFADGRHLWPEFLRLIAECKPSVVFGEQVAGSDGLIWFAGVRATLESIGYRVFGANLCAAGVGALHIRQRLWWCGWLENNIKPRAGNKYGTIGNKRQETLDSGAAGIRQGNRKTGTGRIDAGGSGNIERLGDTTNRKDDERELGNMAEAEGQGRCSDNASDTTGADGRVADTRRQFEGRRGIQRFREGNSEIPEHPPTLCVEGGGASGGLGNTAERGGWRNGRTLRSERSGFWSNSRSIPCKDGKTRRIPVEPEIFPLAPGLPGRVGQLRAAGNSISPQVGAEFIKAVMEEINAKNLRCGTV